VEEDRHLAVEEVLCGVLGCGATTVLGVVESMALLSNLKRVTEKFKSTES
jgi:hypothetical protein